MCLVLFLVMFDDGSRSSLGLREKSRERTAYGRGQGRFGEEEENLSRSYVPVPTELMFLRTAASIYVEPKTVFVFESHVRHGCHNKGVSCRQYLLRIRVVKHGEASIRLPVYLGYLLFGFFETGIGGSKMLLYIG